MLEIPGVGKIKDDGSLEVTGKDAIKDIKDNQKDNIPENVNIIDGKEEEA